MTKLYYITNVGCDDETCGLARISDEDFPKFKRLVENLNKNSTYGCMPTIYVYEIDERLIKKYDNEPGESILYLDDERYILPNGIRTYKEEGVKQVI